MSSGFNYFFQIRAFDCLTEIFERLIIITVTLKIMQFALEYKYMIMYDDGMTKLEVLIELMHSWV